MSIDMQRVLDCALEFFRQRRDEAGRTDLQLDAGTQIFDTGLLDSLAFNALIAHVEQVCGVEIDMLRVDPGEIYSLGDLASQFAAAAD